MEAGDSFTAAAAVLRSDKQKEAVSKAKRLKKYQGNGSVLVSSSASPIGKNHSYRAFEKMQRLRSLSLPLPVLP